MTGLLEHTGLRTDLFKSAFSHVFPCDSMIDVGCGIRPFNSIKCKKHICIEPHGEYAEILKNNGYEVIEKKANDALDEMESVDTIIALDVIEHMTRSDGADFIAKALSKAKKQVVIFTPFGFMPQEETGVTDAWGMHGQDFQRHRSGWTPDDFPGWKCIVCTEFHHRDNKAYGAFIAVHTA